jgi:hypothetical protein
MMRYDEDKDDDKEDEKENEEYLTLIGHSNRL